MLFTDTRLGEQREVIDSEHFLHVIHTEQELNKDITSGQLLLNLICRCSELKEQDFFLFFK